MNTTTIIVLVLLAIIQIILILSVVHISAKTDEMSSTLKEINEKLGKIMYNTGKKEIGRQCPILAPFSIICRTGKTILAK